MHSFIVFTIMSTNPNCSKRKKTFQFYYAHCTVMNTLQFISKYWVWSGSVKFRTKQTHTYTDKFSLLILSVITAVTLILVAFYESTNEYTFNLWVTNTLYCMFVYIQFKSSCFVPDSFIIKITTGDQLSFSFYFAPACFFLNFLPFFKPR